MLQRRSEQSVRRLWSVHTHTHMHSETLYCGSADLADSGHLALAAEQKEGLNLCVCPRVCLLTENTLQNKKDDEDIVFAWI